MKKKLLIMGLTAAVLVVGAGSAFASSKLSLKDKQVISASGKIFDAPKGQPQDFEYKGPGAEYLDYDKLFSLLKMDAATVKEQLASGKSIVEIAESKNVPKQKIIDFFTEIAAKSQEEFNASQGIEPDPSKKEAMIKWTESAINERNIWDLDNEQALAAEKENVNSPIPAAAQEVMKPRSAPAAAQEVMKPRSAPAAAQEVMKPRPAPAASQEVMKPTPAEAQEVMKPRLAPAVSQEVMKPRSTPAASQ